MMERFRLSYGLLGGLLLFGTVGCGGDEDARSTDDGTGARAGTGGAGGTGSIGCPDFAERTQVDVSGEITQDTTWTCDNFYVLTEKVFIVGGATLTVEAGVEVLGEQGSAIVASTEGRLVTEGRADAPVVFTSSREFGARAAGDWAGVVLLGRAPINISGGKNQVEGLDATESRGEYGGDDATHDCGHLRYTRIEFAGQEIAPDNELNALTVSGCGTDTVIEYVQTHQGLDDGIEIFGGSPSVHHVVLTGIQDDAFDWEFGFDGRVQFLVAQQNPAGADLGMESDGNADAHEATPRSNPTLYNVTLIGGAGTGWVPRRGTLGTLGNAIIMNFATAAIDVRDAATAAGAKANPPTLVAHNSIFFNNGPGGTNHFPTESGEGDDDAGFDENAFFRGASLANQFDVDPELGDPTNLTAPGFVPAAGSPAATGGATPPSGFDSSATYIGAFEPGGEDWTEGWTSYPAN